MHIDRPIAIAIILFITILLVFFLFLPAYNTFGSLQTQLGEKKAEFNAEYDYYSQITKTYNDIQAHKDDIKKIDDALPSNPDLGKLVYSLQQQASQNGLIVKDLFLSKSAPKVTGLNQNTVNDIAFSLSLVGNYASLNSFMASLEKSSRIFEVTSISFGAGSSASSPSSTQFSSLDTFTFALQIKTHSY